jgi:gentisate 1,2-dioxygenase
MTTSLTHDPAGFYGRLGPLHYEPLWRIRGALTLEPVTAMVPHLWRYDEVRPLIMEAGDLITAEEAERRVLALKNPGTAAHEVARATDTLWAAIQLVLPGEVAPAHRHTPAALRFVVEGEGGYTTVNDERYDMSPGDLILTPNWSWHGHGHTGGAPMLWLDGLDLPLSHALHTVFAEFPPAEARRPAAPPAGQARTHAFPFAEMQAALEARRDDPGDPYDDILIEYRHPETGGPVMPTMSAAMQLLRPGVRTAAHRHTHSVVYHVAAGSGASTIGGQRFEWTRGDTFAVPGWAPHRHANPTNGDALLFSFSDAPVLDALGLSRESAVEEETH